MPRLTQRTGLVELMNDDSLLQVISLKPKAFDFRSWSPLTYRLLVGTDRLESCRNSGSPASAIQRIALFTSDTIFPPR